MSAETQTKHLEAEKYLKRIRDRDLEVIPASEWKGAWNVLYEASIELEMAMSAFNILGDTDVLFLTAYDGALACGLLREGKGLFTKLESKDVEIEGLKIQLGELERRYDDCNKLNIDNEITISQLREKLGLDEAEKNADDKTLRGGTSSNDYESEHS